MITEKPFWLHECELAAVSTMILLNMADIQPNGCFWRHSDERIGWVSISKSSPCPCLSIQVTKTLSHSSRIGLCHGNILHHQEGGIEIFLKIPADPFQYTT